MHKNLRIDCQCENFMHMCIKRAWIVSVKINEIIPLELLMSSLFLEYDCSVEIQ